MLRSPFGSVAGVLVGVLIESVATTAYAQDEVCREAFEKSDLLLKAGATPVKLLDAREKLRACAAPTCKEWMVADCTKRLAELEGRIPTVVFAARDENGAEIADATILEGEKLVTARLDGRAFETDPGEHVFVFALRDGSRHEVKVLVHEGKKAQQVTYEAPLAVRSRPPAAPTESGENAPTKTVDVVSTNPLTYVGLGVAALGVGVGAVTGAMAIAKSGTNECIGLRCTDAGLADIDSGRSLATVSTVAFVVGLLGAGLAVYGLASPRHETRQARTFSPWIGARSLGIEGAF